MGTQNEGFPAIPTCKGLLPCVDFLVLRKAGTLTKCFPTLAALPVLLPSMSSPVLSEVAALLEGSTAVIACKGFLSSVD